MNTIFFDLVLIKAFVEQFKAVKFSISFFIASTELMLKITILMLSVSCSKIVQDLTLTVSVCTLNNFDNKIAVLSRYDFNAFPL